ncbi:MAG: hypothetical protein ACO4CH_10800, partial [Saprospiraceae bacterium]
SRYKNNKLIKLNDGRVVYKSKIYRNIPKRDDDIYIITQAGDRLDTLAFQFFKDSSLWLIIAAANNIHNAPFGFASIWKCPGEQ